MLLHGQNYPKETGAICYWHESSDIIFYLLYIGLRLTSFLTAVNP